MDTISIAEFYRASTDNNKKVPSAGLLTEFSGEEYPLLDAEGSINILKRLGYDELAASFQKAGYDDIWIDVPEGRLNISTYVDEPTNYLSEFIEFYDYQEDYKYLYEYSYSTYGCENHVTVKKMKPGWH